MQKNRLGLHCVIYFSLRLKYQYHVHFFPCREIMKSESYTKSVDMWALGVVTYVLLCGYMPFDETHGAKTRWAMDFPREEWNSISGTLLTHLRTQIIRIPCYYHGV